MLQGKEALPDIENPTVFFRETFLHYVSPGTFPLAAVTQVVQLDIFAQVYDQVNEMAISISVSDAHPIFCLPRLCVVHSG